MKLRSLCFLSFLILPSGQNFAGEDNEFLRLKRQLDPCDETIRGQNLDAKDVAKWRQINDEFL